MKKLDLSGVRFGWLVAISESDPIKSPSRTHTAWLCKCDCGAEVVVKTNNLKLGTTKSCGCYVEYANKKRRGPRINNKREYETWARIKSRCNNPNSLDYPDYGGRGISVCERWNSSFENFLQDMGKRPSDIHSIDRINVDGDYEPGNCRWATNRQQSRNKRNNIWLEFDGKKMVLQDWADYLGINWVTLYERLQNHPIEKALTTKEEFKCL